MATKDRDRFEHAERSDRQDLSPLNPSAHKEKISRKKWIAPLATVGLSVVAGAAVGYLLFSDPPHRPPAPQRLASAPSPVSEIPDRPIETADAEEKKPHRQKPARESRSFDRIVVAGTASGGSSTMPAAPAPAPAPEPNDSERARKEPKQRAEAEFSWPSTQLYHLYRKRDKLHYYTIDAQTFETYQVSEGFKPRLAPGYVYTENLYPKKLREIHPYGLYEPVYVFMRDQGEETVPLYRLRNFGGNKDMYTSWEHIRQEWIDKGWADEGIAGYIFRA